MEKTLVLAACLAGLLSLAACAQAASPAEGEITGKVWVLDSLNGAAPVANTTVTAEFNEDGKVGGSGGCNRYSGQYTLSGNSFQLTGPIAPTMMACEAPVMEQESAYFQALEAAKSFALKGDQLMLSDAGGQTVITYTAQSQGLEGTSWQAIGYNNGKQAVTSVLVGTELTAQFGADGQLSGSAGCNNYFGPYQIAGEKITIGSLGSTKKLCAEPAGIMEQESQYLVALQSAATYKVEGERLELRTADGALAANFQRK